MIKVPPRFVMPWIVAVLATAVALVLHLTVRFETVRLGYEVGELRVEQERLLEKKRLLSLEATTLRHVPRVEKLAKHVLGLRPPAPHQVVELKERP